MYLVYKTSTDAILVNLHRTNTEGGCKHGLLFPLFLVMTNSRKCENYEFDPEKAGLHLQKKENRKEIKYDTCY